MPLFQILEKSRELWIITKPCMVKFTWVNHVDESSVDLSENIVSFTGRGIELNCISLALLVTQIMFSACFVMSRSFYISIYWNSVCWSQGTIQPLLSLCKQKTKRLRDPLKAQLKNKDRFFIAKGFYSIKGRRVICIIRCRNCIKITCGSRFITGA